jgi:excisionase family DNA binding protein
LPGKGHGSLFMSDKHNKLRVEAVNKSPSILTKQQAAEYLQVSTRYLEHAVNSGRLRAFKPTGKLWRVSQRNLDAFLESGASIGGAA